MTVHGLRRKELNSNVFVYILSCIDESGYDLNLITDAEKLQFVADCFKREYLFPANLNRYGSYQKTFGNWLMGLPSCFNVDFENYRIIEIAKSWGSLPIDATDKQEDKILDSWFSFIACKTFQLMKKHKVLPY
jgi:hypothetical protein